MRLREMDIFKAHCDHYFQQDNVVVIHPTNTLGPHIDVLKYPPTEKYPFWKLVTMGASDFRMHRMEGSFGNRNEYMFFIHPSEDLDDNDTLDWYFRQLMEIAIYPRMEDAHVSYGHSMEWGSDGESDMVGAFFEMPQMIEDSGILQCKLGFMKTAVCLQAVLLTRSEVDRVLEIGPEAFSEYLYPEDETAPRHYLAERYRTEKF